MHDWTAWRFYRHMPVYLANGRLLGRVIEVDHGVDYVHVQQGRLIVRDWYLPIGTVEKVDPSGVHLRINVGNLRKHDWQVPSDEYLLHQGSTPGYEYTSPADIPTFAGD